MRRCAPFLNCLESWHSLHAEDGHDVVPPRLAFRTRRAPASLACRAGGGPAVSALGGDARGCWGGHAEDPCARKGARDSLAGKPASAPDTPGQGEDDALRGAPVWGQLESSWGVFDPASGGLGARPSLTGSCACIHNTPSTFLGVGDGGGAGLHHLI